MRRRLFIYGAILAVFFLGLVLARGGNTRTVAEQHASEATGFQESDVEVVEESTQAHFSSKNAPADPEASQRENQNQHQGRGETYRVVKVVDGDTLDVLIDHKAERLRLIGIDTPETVDPRKPVQCFGVEASDKAKALLTGKEITIESDPSQGERDKYDRLLRYVFLPDGTNFNLLMIKEGYAHEYTYGVPYRYQAEFKEAQKEAMQNKAGLWGAVCATAARTGEASTESLPPSRMSSSQNNVSPSPSCTIKGNISATGEKIFHVVGCGSYDKAVINEDAGEKWFCSPQEAEAAGWRKAKNC